MEKDKKSEEDAEELESEDNSQSLSQLLASPPATSIENIITTDTPAEATAKVTEVKLSAVENKSAKKTDTKKEEDPKEKICHFFVQFRCKFGRKGTECEFPHPKICLSLMNKGTKGCPNAEECNFVHPKMCAKSLSGKKCEAKRCFLGHVQGTRDSKKDTTEKKETKPEEQVDRKARTKFFNRPSPKAMLH